MGTQLIIAQIIELLLTINDKQYQGANWLQVQGIGGIGIILLARTKGVLMHDQNFSISQRTI